VDCSIYRAARTSREAALAAGSDPRRITAADESRRPLPRTAPVLLEPPRLVDRITRLQFDRAPGQIALVALMVVAFTVVALSRLSGGTAPAASVPPPFVAITPTALPTSEPTAVPGSATPSAGPSSSPAASFRTTYKVKKGDTLQGIAARYKVTITAIRKVNALKSTSTIHPGQVLKIP